LITEIYSRAPRGRVD